MNEQIVKYPRTRHIEGSRLQPGDEDLSAVRLDELKNRHLVVEEKVDGANAALHFTPTGELRLQSRGHYLTGGHRERHFALFKTWAHSRRAELHDLIGDRYIVYGEWLYAKHTIFYDALPHYFLEFDVLDLANGTFLPTTRRHAMFANSPIVSVPVLWQGDRPRGDALAELVSDSLYKSAEWRRRLTQVAAQEGLDPARIRAETDAEDHAEGLYIKAETDDAVTGRYKFVRASFLSSVTDSGSHWQDRPILPNQLAPEVDLFT